MDYLRLRVTPRTSDALDVAIDVYEAQGVVNVFIGDFLPIELTAPININSEPPGPSMDVIRAALSRPPPVLLTANKPHRLGPEPDVSLSLMPPGAPERPSTGHLVPAAQQALCGCATSRRRGFPCCARSLGRGDRDSQRAVLDRSA
ncbi:protein of unknown function [Modestobacter italicus]|uniref:Uncharacterized protein n=1 Tax=Modestobacter italicus (strain DSM 44449 / CECT 9708 / BC 501) TaxID=2732864 RepID=I4EWP3_MODI5|nr:protein of unknown function [Modestobacter marinus]